MSSRGAAATSLSIFVVLALHFDRELIAPFFMIDPPPPPPRVRAITYDCINYSALCYVSAWNFFSPIFIGLVSARIVDT